MEITKLAKILIVFLISLNAYGDLIGEYEKVSGNEDCPTGHVMMKGNAKNKRILIFGSTHSWNLTASNTAKTTEAVEGGCTYELNYVLSKNHFNSTTKRVNCSEKSENSIILENIDLKEKVLTYRYGVESSKQEICKYTKIK